MQVMIGRQIVRDVAGVARPAMQAMTGLEIARDVAGAEALVLTHMLGAGANVPSAEWFGMKPIHGTAASAPGAAPRVTKAMIGRKTARDVHRVEKPKPKRTPGMAGANARHAG